MTSQEGSFGSLGNKGLEANGGGGFVACVVLSGCSLEENTFATDLEVLMLLTSQHILPRAG